MPPIDSEPTLPDVPPVEGDPVVPAAHRIWSGWFVEPSSGQTDVPLSAAGLDGRLYAFAKGVNDRRVYLQTAGLDGWDGSWVEVPGRVVWAPLLMDGLEGAGVDRRSTMRTDVSVAAATVGGRLYLVAKATGAGRLYANVKLARGDRLAAWGAWHPLPFGPTDVAPATAGTSSQLFVFRTGLDHSIYATRRSGLWAPWKFVDGPALFRVERGSGAIHVNPDRLSLRRPASACGRQARSRAG